jgi:hypothetical protein
VLKMIEWRWGLEPLTQRDANAKNLAEVLDFSTVRTDVPDIPLLASFASVACGLNSVAKRPPDPISTPEPPSGSGSAGAGDSNSTGASTLARTGGTEGLLIAGAAAITGGMALRAAHRRAQENASDPVPSEP